MIEALWRILLQNSLNYIFIYPSVQQYCPQGFTLTTYLSNGVKLYALWFLDWHYFLLQDIGNYLYMQNKEVDQAMTTVHVRVSVLL